jgi:hypothetical protein
MPEISTANQRSFLTVFTVTLGPTLLVGTLLVGSIAGYAETPKVISGAPPESPPPISQPRVPVALTHAQPSETAFVDLAERDPRGLVQWIRSGDFTPGLLSLAAEALGRVHDEALAVPALLELLHHREVVVQEGAIYGLASHMTPAVRRELVELHRTTGTHPLIVEILQEVLEPTV